MLSSYVLLLNVGPLMVSDSAYGRALEYAAVRVLVLLIRSRLISPTIVF